MYLQSFHPGPSPSVYYSITHEQVQFGKFAQVRPPGPVPVSCPGLRLWTNETTPDSVFLSREQMRPPRTGFFGTENNRDNRGGGNLLQKRDWSLKVVPPVNNRILVRDRCQILLSQVDTRHGVRNVPTRRGGQTGETGGIHHYSGWVSDEEDMVDDDGFQGDREIWEVTHVCEEDLETTEGEGVDSNKNCWTMWPTRTFIRSTKGQKRCGGGSTGCRHLTPCSLQSR
jgi:hypothetical protein